MSAKRKVRRALQLHKRKIVALLMTLAMLVTALPTHVIAISSASPESYLCGHVHDSACGYAEGSEGTPCTHIHNETCGYAEGSPCTDVHIHDASCGYAEGSPCTDDHVHDASCGYAAGSPCTYVHVHDATCGYDPETGEGCTDVHTHNASCGYVAPHDCTYVHTHSESCGYVEAHDCTYVHTHNESCGYAAAAPCTHIHDEACGYVAPVPGVPCSHTCEILSFDGYELGTAIDTYTADAGASCAEIAEALPEELPGTAACVKGSADIPVRWVCAEFTGAAGVYTFRAELDNEHCAYAVADDPETEDVDESEMPFIAVTVPEAETEPTEPPVDITEPPVDITEPPVEQTTEMDVRVVSDATGTVTVTGPMPEEAYLEVKEVAVEAAKELLGEAEAVVLFAYDIKLMLPGALDEATGQYAAPTEYQPTSEYPLTVSITPLQSIDAPAVEVVHIAEDAETGEPTPQPVEDVTATENTVEFSADGFSVFVIRVKNSASGTRTIYFPVGDYSIKYSTAENGSYAALTSLSVTLGDTTTYDALYFKVIPNAGFDDYPNDVVVMENGNPLTPTNDVYTLDVSGASATTNITVTVTGVKITGTPVLGQTLTAEVSGNPGSTFSYVWKLGDTATGTFSEIPAQTGSSFVLPDTAEYESKYLQVVATDETNPSTIYTSAPVGPITSGATIIFDLAMGNIEIGLADDARRIYRGINSAGALVTGTHDDANEYVVMQSNEGTVTSNRVILIGNSSVPQYNVTLSGVNCASAGNKSLGGIYAIASDETLMALTLKLSGNNYVGRVNYSTSGQSSLGSTTSSSLTITSAAGNGSTSGYLEAESTVPWSAAIGGIDERSNEAARNIYIKGGTIRAIAYHSGQASSDTGTSAIGGGGNGACNIVISGGSVIATNNGTGATIGGGGGNTTEGGEASVTISGGTVSATNNCDNGVAIGGGSSIALQGGNATVNISGGTVNAYGNIGGGYSHDLIGGTAAVTISGGIVSTSKSIGGGNSPSANGGAATVTISGGTVTASRITGGKNGDNSYQDATVFIEGASVHISDTSNITAVHGTDPATLAYVQVYCDVVDIARLENYDAGLGTVKVTAAELTDGDTTYSFTLTDIYPDEEGKLYFWLSVGYSVQSLTIAGTQYSVIETVQERIATITRTSSTVGAVLGAVLNHGSATGYAWESSADGLTEWTSLPMGTGQTYTVVEGDLSRFIRVSIYYDENGETKSVTSDRLRITPRPSAVINYQSNEPGHILTAQLLNGEGSSFSYQWQRFETNQWVDVGSNSVEYELTLSDIGKEVHVVITDASESHTSIPVYIRPPTISVTVPLSTIVTVSGDGVCSAPTGEIENNSSVPVYVTNVQYTWITDSETPDANELFFNYASVIARLKLGTGVNEATYTFTGATPAAQAPNATNGVIPAISGETPGKLSLPWEFDLGKSQGNYIRLAIAAGQEVYVASITYTVDYRQPATP